MQKKDLNVFNENKFIIDQQRKYEKIKKTPARMLPMWKYFISAQTKL